MNAQRLALCTLLAVSMVSCGGDGGGDGQSPAQTSSAGPGTSAKATAADYTTVGQYLYVSYYGRPGDPSGSNFWDGYLATGNAPTSVTTLSGAYGTNAAVKTVLDNFGNSAESTALYGSDNTAIVNAIYQNLFNRAPDAGGLAFYVNGLTAGSITRAQAALAIAGGAQGSDSQLIQCKVAVATAFTAGLVTPEQIAAYSGLAANAKIRTLLSAVTCATDATVAAQSLLAALSSSGGGGGGGSGSQCIDLAFNYTPGNRLDIDYNISGALAGTMSLSTTIVGPRTFQGVNAFEADTQVTQAATTAGISYSSTSTTQDYSNLTSATDITHYGNTSHTTTQAGPTNQVTDGLYVYTPAWLDQQWSMAPGSTITRSYGATSTGTTTVNGVAHPYSITATNNEQLTFVAVESVTVPSGTYNACKFQSVVTSGTTSVTTLTWYVVGKGVPVKIQSGALFVATKVLINGAAL